MQRESYTAINRASVPLPALFLPHGAPPIPIEPCSSATWLESAAAGLASRPKAIVFMSPHFRTDVFTVSTDPNPATLMDFDDDTDDGALAQLLTLRYPCRGDPSLGNRVAAMLRAGGLEAETQARRGLDHGVWTPLCV